jgi:mannosyltransferase
MLTTLEQTRVQPTSHAVPTPRTGRTTAVLAYLLPAVVAAAAGLWRSTDRQLWNDEYATWWSATLDARGLLALTRHLDSVQAPYYLLMHYWVAAFGDSPLALRAPSVLALIAACVLITEVGRRAYTLPAGVLAGALFPILPSVGLHGQQARSYTFAIALAVLASLLVTNRRPGAGTRLAYAATVACLGAMHVVALLILAAHAAAFLLQRRAGTLSRRGLYWWTVAAAAGVLPVVPLIAWGSGQISQIGQVEIDAGAAVFLVNAAFWSNLSAFFVLWLAVLGLCLVTAGRPVRTMLAVWAVGPYAFAVAVHDLSSLAQLRYFLFALPPWFIAAAAAIVEFTRRSHGARRWVFAALVPAIIAPMAPGNVQVRHDPFDGYPDYAGAVAFIAANREPGDGIAYGGKGYGGLPYDNALFTPLPIAAAYGLRNDGPPPGDVFTAVPAQQRGGYSGTACPDPGACLKPYTRVWLLTTAPGAPLAEVQPAQAAALNRSFQVAKVGAYTNVRAILLIRSGPA